MPCDKDGCDIHDYPIASPWCEYKWHLERTARASENTDKTVRKLTEAINLMADMMDELVESSGRENKRPYRPPEKQTPDKPFRGVNLN